jgi:hypothetical protein
MSPKTSQLVASRGLWDVEDYVAEFLSGEDVFVGGANVLQREVPVDQRSEPAVGQQPSHVADAEAATPSGTGSAPWALGEAAWYCATVAPRSNIMKIAWSDDLRIGRLSATRLELRVGSG